MDCTTAEDSASGASSGKEESAPTNLNGRKDTHHLPPEIVPEQPTLATASATEPAPSQPQPGLGTAVQKEEVPKNTADAVAEAIKAATAVTRGTGGPHA